MSVQSRKQRFMQKDFLRALALTALSLPAVALLLNPEPREMVLPLVLCALSFFLLFLFGSRVHNAVLSLPQEYALALFLSASTALGVFLDRSVSFENMGFPDVLKWIFCAAVLALPVQKGIRLLCGALAAWARKEQAPADPERGPSPGRFLRRLTQRPAACFLFSLGMILVCWLPVWLAYYPGLWNYDPWQAEQVLTGVYSKHHPLLHTLLLGNCYRLALRQGNPNLAPILYSAIQGGVCALVYALACSLIRQRTKSTLFYLLTLLFFALFPVHPVLAMSTTKDTLFSAMILLAVLIFLSLEPSGVRRQKFLAAAEIPVLALIVLLRNNAVYCFLLLILLCLFKIRQKHWRRILAVLAAGTLLGTVADRGLGRLLNASPSLMAEMCSVPSQMAGRVKDRVEDLDPETSAFLEEFYSQDELSYSPSLADGTKCCLALSSRQDLIRYAEGSFRLFLKYPAVCVDSLLYTTEGLWNLLDVSHTRIYGTENRQGYLATDIKPGYQITPDSRLPALARFLETLLTDNAFLRVPVLRFLFAPAFYVDLLLLSFLVLLRGRRRSFLLVPLFLIFLVLTIVLGPGILPRYVYPLMVCAPLLIWMSMKSVLSRT